MSQPLELIRNLNIFVNIFFGTKHFRRHSLNPVFAAAPAEIAYPSGADSGHTPAGHTAQLPVTSQHIVFAQSGDTESSGSGRAPLRDDYKLGNEEQPDSSTPAEAAVDAPDKILTQSTSASSAPETEHDTARETAHDRTGTTDAEAAAPARRRRRLPLGIQIGVGALAVLALWWSWPLWASAERPFSSEPANTIPLSQGSLQTTAASTPVSAATRASLQTLAIVNPDNLPRTQEDADESAASAPDSGGDSQSVSSTAEDESDDASADTGAQTSAAATAPAAGEAAATGSAETAGEEDETTDSNADVGSSTADVPDTNPDVDTDVEADVDADVEFPEVGEGDSDQLTPFLVEVEIPAPVEEPGTPNGLLPATLTQPANGQVNGVQAELILLPTATPLADSGSLQTQAARLPRVEIIPAIGVRFTPTPAPSPTVTPSPTPTPIPAISGRGRMWSSFTPGAAPDTDHYWVGNPFAGISANRSASPSYQFGSTAGNRYRPHHGIDISNPSGTPVRSGVVGEVVHAGLDDPELLGPYNNFYGNTVVILLDQRLPVAGGELDVYLLYGHLSEVRTEVGERVGPDDIVGLVGMTGIAIGPHLHVEVRLGANTYNHSVNPYLWMEPPTGSGTVAVRLLTADGRTWAGAKVSIARFDGGAAVWARQIETYLDTENIGPDPAWGENGAMGDVPAGSYYLIANIEGEAIRAELTVREGETTFVEVRTQQ